MNNPNEFLIFAESLKLVRNAEIERDDTNIVNDVYTDLLPNNSIISKFNLPRTSILMGRKGTGKSTIIQKSLFDIAKSDNTVGLYVDVKTLYDSATPTLMCDNQNMTSMIQEELIKYFVYKNFLKEVIEKTRTNFKQMIDNENLLTRVSHYFKGKESEVYEALNAITISTEEVFKSIDTSLFTFIKSSYESKSEATQEVKTKLSMNPSLGANLSDSNYETFKKEFDTTIYKYLDIKNCLIGNFLKIRKITGLKYLYIYLDDYSEIDKKAQELFMDWFVVPLNNFSEDFIKFKIASYPNRFYAGKLDNQKYDEINLDFYNAFYTYKDISKMEQAATEYVCRLIKNRFKVYLPNKSIKDYFDISEEELWNLLFEVSMNNPRKIGYILSYCYETNLIYNKNITVAAILNGARRYFEEITQKYFESNKFVLRAFQDMASIENQKELIVSITNKQIANKVAVNKSTAKKYNIVSPPTSHFLVANQLAPLLETLELNGYITTYSKLTDKVNNPSTLFALDYGLCRKHNLSYGGAKNTNIGRYYREPIFTFNSLIKEHFNNSQTIICDNNHEFPFDLLSEIEKLSMHCPKCVSERIFSICHIEISNKSILEKLSSYESVTLKVDDGIEYKILDFLNIVSNDSRSAPEISQELDCSWQLVSKRAEKLLNKELLEIDTSKNNNQRRHYKITCKASQILCDNRSNDIIN